MCILLHGEPRESILRKLRISGFDANILMLDIAEIAVEHTIKMIFYIQQTI